MAINLNTPPGAPPPLGDFGELVATYCALTGMAIVDHIDDLANSYGGTSAFEDLPPEVQWYYQLNDTYCFLHRYGEPDNGPDGGFSTLLLVPSPYREMNGITGEEDDKIIVLQDVSEDHGFDIAMAPDEEGQWIAYGRRDPEGEWEELPVTPINLLFAAALNAIIARGRVHRDPETEQMVRHNENGLRLEIELPPLESQPDCIFNGWWITAPKLRDRQHMTGAQRDYWLHEASGLLWHGTESEWSQAACRNSCRC